MAKDFTSPEYLAGRQVFLKDQEKLFDLVVNKQGGDIKGGIVDIVYDLYTQEHLTTEQVAERVDQLVGSGEASVVTTPEQKVEEALDRAFSLAGYDGSHHKEHCIDQMVRALTGKDYREWVRNYEYGDSTERDEDGELELQYEWSIGIPS